MSGDVAKGAGAAPVRLVLLDLDGTLADTAPDLAAAINRCLAELNRAPLPLHELRPWASHGARGLIHHALGWTPADPGYEALRDRFLEHYAADICRDTVLFPGMEQLLAELEAAGLRWGIVTNKLARFTGPLVRALGLAQRAACVVSGDTTPHAKPDPAPVRHALQVCGVEAQSAVYVGDDLRDIQAGRAAGLRTCAAAYGYTGGAADVGDWQPDHIIGRPLDLLPWVLPERHPAPR